MAGVVTNFASEAGQQPASQVDSAFAQALAQITPANSIWGNNTGGAANAIPLTPTQVYAMLQSVLPVEVTAFMGGAQGGASWQIGRYQSQYSLLLHQTISIASAGVAATGSTTFTIADNGVTIGTVVFAASSATGVVTITAGSYDLVATHVLTITGPVSPDATLANVNITLGAGRTP